MRRTSLAALIPALIPVLILTLVPGCLSNTYNIPKQELQTLAQVDPATRGQRVRVVQRFGSQDQPPEAQPVGINTHIVLVPDLGPSTRSRSGGGNISPGGSGKGGQGLADAAGDEAIVWVVLATVAVVWLALTEGLRYDGWTELHPMHPVHLYGPYGEYTWMPLAQITPQTAAWAQRAVVRESEGPWRPIARAPLNRRGFTYAVLMGQSEIFLADGDQTSGFISHIRFGGFFTRELGLLLDVGFVFGQDEFGNALFDTRNALELDYYPLDAGRLHGGIFGQLGFSQRLDDSPAGGDSTSFMTGGGALLQLELTTRLTITARAGITQIHDEITSDLTVGLSIY